MKRAWINWKVIFVSIFIFVRIYSEYKSAIFQTRYRDKTKNRNTNSRNNKYRLCFLDRCSSGESCKFDRFWRFNTTNKQDQHRTQLFILCTEAKATWNLVLQLHQKMYTNLTNIKDDIRFGHDTLYNFPYARIIFWRYLLAHMHQCCVHALM